MTDIKIEGPDGKEKTEHLDVPGAETDKDTQQVDKAVSDIVRHESDEALEAEDAKVEQINATVGDFRPWYEKAALALLIILVIAIIGILAVPSLRHQVQNNLHIKHLHI